MTVVEPSLFPNAIDVTARFGIRSLLSSRLLARERQLPGLILHWSEEQHTEGIRISDTRPHTPVHEPGTSARRSARSLIENIRDELCGCTDAIDDQKASEVAIQQDVVPSCDGGRHCR